MSLMVLAPIPWAGRVWELPFLTALVPSGRACRCRGDPAACRTVQMPSVEREDARRMHRERQRLIAERVQHVNRIKGLLAIQRVYTFRPLGRDRWEQLKEVRIVDGRDLPQRLRGEIERELRRLELVLE
jgi:transposase